MLELLLYFRFLVIYSFLKGRTRLDLRDCLSYEAFPLFFFTETVFTTQSYELSVTNHCYSVSNQRIMILLSIISFYFAASIKVFKFKLLMNNFRVEVSGLYSVLEQNKLIIVSFYLCSLQWNQLL